MKYRLLYFAINECLEKYQEDEIFPIKNMSRSIYLDP